MFTKESFPTGLLQKSKRVFKGTRIEVAYNVPGQINITVNGIKTTFFQFDYPLIKKLKHYRGVPLASVQEIAAMKAFSIGKRLFYRDYVDWYFILKEKHANLSEVIKIAGKKFGEEFNDRLFLGQLVSLKDIPDQDINFFRDKVSRKTIQTFLEKTVRDFKL